MGEGLCRTPHLTSGLGSGAGRNLPSLLEQTKSRTERGTEAVFDEASTGKPNFAEAERLPGSRLGIRKQGSAAEQRIRC